MKEIEGENRRKQVKTQWVTTWQHLLKPEELTATQQTQHERMQYLDRI